MELKPNYLRDPENFLRDIACIPTESTRPFFKVKDKIYSAEKAAHKNPFNEDTRTFDSDFIADPKTGYYPRYMHIDLGLKKDAVGISMCHAPYFVDRQIAEIEVDGVKQKKVRLPQVHFDFFGRLKAMKGEEILLSEVREIIYNIHKRGYYLALITFDGFQSVDSIQILRSQGYKVGRLSIDRTATKLMLDKHARNEDGLKRVSTEGQTLAAMQALKDALYDDRLNIPYHDYWIKEALGAEIDYKRNKVDHKPRGTIDLLQSIAGSIYNLINNEREFDIRAEEEESQQTGDSFYDEVDFDDSPYYKGPGQDLWVA
jgi:hypothetical protein